jgi:hypothetical protein
MNDEGWKPGDADRRQVPYRYDREPKDLGWIKKALVGALLGLAVHFASGIWWAATMTAKLSFLETSSIQMRSEFASVTAQQYKQTDATKDFASVHQRVDRIETRVTTLENNRFITRPSAGQ